MAKAKSKSASLDLSQYVTVSEASKRTRYSVSHIRLLAQTGQIDAVKVGLRAWLVSVESIRAHERKKTGETSVAH